MVFKVSFIAIPSLVLASCGSMHDSESQNSQASLSRSPKPGVYSLVDCNRTEKDLNDIFGKRLQVKGDQSVSISIKISANGVRSLTGSFTTPEWSQTEDLDGTGISTNKATSGKFKNLVISKVTFVGGGSGRGAGNQRAALTLAGKVDLESEGKVKSVSVAELRLMTENGSDNFFVQFLSASDGNPSIDVQPQLFDSRGTCELKNMELLSTLTGQ